MATITTFAYDSVAGVPSYTSGNIIDWLYQSTARPNGVIPGADAGLNVTTDGVGNVLIDNGVCTLAGRIAVLNAGPQTTALSPLPANGFRTSYAIVMRYNTLTQTTAIVAIAGNTIANPGPAVNPSIAPLTDILLAYVLAVNTGSILYTVTDARTYINAGNLAPSGSITYAKSDLTMYSSIIAPITGTSTINISAGSLFNGATCFVSNATTGGFVLSVNLGTSTLTLNQGDYAPLVWNGSTWAVMVTKAYVDNAVGTGIMRNNAGPVQIPSDTDAQKYAVTQSNGLISYNTTYGFMEFLTPDGWINFFNQIGVKGYMAGGANQATTTFTAIDGFIFATEIRNLLSAVLASGTQVGAAGVNSSIKGYAMGGSNGLGGTGSATTIQALTFLTEIIANISGVLSVARQVMPGVNSSTKGYALGGMGAAVPVPSNVIDGIIFSTESVAAISATLSTVRNGQAGFNSISKGYSAGGSSSNFGATLVNVIDGLIFSTESAAAISATLSSSRTQVCGLNSLIKGYSAGGSALTTIDALIFSNETNSAISGVLNAGLSGVCGINSPLKGIFMGGITASTSVTTIQKILFATEAMTVLSAVLGTARDIGTSFQSGNL
jgi:hypothetical protein